MSKFDILKYYEIALRDVENIIGVIQHQMLELIKYVYELFLIT